MLVLGVLFYVIKEGYLRRYAFPVGLLIGGAIGNVYDRFVYDGVVDYIAWHCGFEFAVFNYADIAIDVAVAWLLIENYFFSSKREIG
jgi:signal peptidase II